MIIDCISDLHGDYPSLEGGDLLIVAGDLTARDTFDEYLFFFCWLKDQKYKKKVVIGGNHDNMLEKCYIGSDEKVTYLRDSGTEFDGLKIWGSPWTKTFPGMNPNCKAFTVDTDEELAEKWCIIPRDTNILITHEPPNGILDVVEGKGHVGSMSLRNMVISNYFSNLKLHIFGHIHGDGGKVLQTTLATFVNASIMDENYDTINKPVRVIL